jgi:hypothetical protein
MKDKDDAEKPRWDLLPLDVLEGAVRVFTNGAKKYSDDGWKTVPDAKKRYYAALMRHLKSWQAGEGPDPEDGESPLAHALCDLIIVAWHEAKDQRARPPVEI